MVNKEPVYLLVVAGGGLCLLGRYWLQHMQFSKSARHTLYHYPIRDKVNQQLDRLVTENILEPVHYAEWAAPIVLFLESDQVPFFICGNFRQPVNAVAKVDRYPLPKAEDLFVQLAGGKLELTQAYQQVLLDNESKRLYSHNQHIEGLFQYMCLPFGISVSQKFFKHYWKAYCKGYPYDILVAGKTEAVHVK